MSKENKKRKDIELHDVSFDNFIKVLDYCKGDVYLETPEGDTLNLKSKLCQLIGLSSLLSKSDKVIDTSIRCTDPEDEVLLLRLNLYGEMPDEIE